MRAKLAVADCWYREGGTAALAQAEQEYKDFITFFPDAPEAAEAQMRVGDIYFKQMDVPDRDYTKALHAEEEYRTMLKQYPDAPKTIIDQATQKLREVQEMLATREALNAAFYATHENWPATIARYQTVVDQYPQYSHMDDALIGLGDTYEQEARIVRSQPTCVPNVPSPTPCLPEAAKAHLEQQFDGRAADAYRKVVLEHAAAPHVEDAKERLVGMNLPVPTPTPEQIAASETLEGSRAQYTMSKRLELLFLHKPDTVTAAQTGAPPLDDAAATVAPTIVKELQDAYVAAVNPNAGRPTLPAATDAQPTSDASGTPAAPPVTDAAPSLSDIPATGSGSSAGTPNTMTEAAPSSGATGNHLGVEVLTPGVSTGSGAASSLPAATGAPDKNYGLSTVAPKDSTPLPAAEKAADAPDQLNDVPAGQPAQTTGTNGKKNPPPVDKNDESSSKKKPKKGLDKINPF
jgi:outer membrane protein assembly factor BamD